MGRPRLARLRIAARLLGVGAAQHHGTRVQQRHKTWLGLGDGSKLNSHKMMHKAAHPFLKFLGSSSGHGSIH